MTKKKKSSTQNISDSHVHYGAGIMSVDVETAMKQNPERLEAIQEMWDNHVSKGSLKPMIDPIAEVRSCIHSMFRVPQMCASTLDSYEEQLLSLFNLLFLFYTGERSRAVLDEYHRFLNKKVLNRGVLASGVARLIELHGYNPRDDVYNPQSEERLWIGTVGMLIEFYSIVGGLVRNRLQNKESTK